MNTENEEEKPTITDFTHLSPFFKHSNKNRVHRIKQPVAVSPSVEDETMVGMDREHESKKKKHNALLGRNFFIRSTNQANRSIIHSTIRKNPRKRVVPLFNGPVPEEADVVDWNQVHKPNDRIENENEDMVVLSRILEIEHKPIPIGFKPLKI